MSGIESLLLVANGLLLWIWIMLWSIKDEVKKLNTQIKSVNKLADKNDS